MPDFNPSDRSKIKRIPERGNYNRQVVYEILDEALVCQVGFQVAGQPFIIPTNFARQEDCIILHGAKASRMLKHIAAGHPVCVSVTILDGIIFARSVFEHSMRYRSVVAFGHGHLLETASEKIPALRQISEHICAGRWDDARQPNSKELEATSVAMISIEDASAKIQEGMPEDPASDLSLPYWVGVLPLKLQAQSPISAPNLDPKISVPEYLKNIK